MSLRRKFLYVLRQISSALREKRITPIITPVSNDNMLAGKNAIIVGGSGGIGYSIANRLSQSGCNVVITGRNKDKVEKVAEKIGHNVSSVVLDISDFNNLKSCLVEITEGLPNSRVDILVNAAGVSSSVDFFDVTEDEWDKIMNANIKGMFFVSQAISEYMIKRKQTGHILNVSSAASIRPAWRPYQISKWAVNGFTKGLADTLLPYGIIVNGIAPGPVATPMLGKKEGDSLYNPSNPSGRFASPEEIANLALFLVSEMGDLVVGETYVISGGAGTLTYHN